MSPITVINRGVGSVTHKADTTKEVYDPYSRQHYKERFKGMSAVLRGDRVPAMMGGGRFNPIENGVIQDVAQYRKDMEMNKRHYEKGHTIKLTPDVKNTLWKKAARLKQQIVIGMVPQDELHPVRNAQRVINGKSKMVTVVDEQRLMNTRAIERNKVWYKRNRGNLSEFKRIMRVLEPNDPKITGITESWRLRTKVKKEVVK